jgi:hypothetical protein
VAVTTGLSVTDQVIVAGAAFLDDGASIRVVAAP